MAACVTPAKQTCRHSVKQRESAFDSEEMKMYDAVIIVNDIVV